jgi:ribosome-associated translation inhibitor RaiA
MMIQINSDKHVNVNAHLANYIEAHINHSLNRFGRQLIRVNVHLSDVDGEKSGATDKRCMMEARPAGYRPISVSCGAENMQQAVTVAAGKMKRLLENSFGRLADKHAGDSVRFLMDASYEGLDG